MDENPLFHLSVVAFSFTTEGGEWDDPHKTESWRFEYYPEDDHSLPLENAIFVQYKRNEIMPDALENKLLDADEDLKEGLVVDEVKKQLQPDIHFFAIENSVAIPTPPPRINIRSNLHIVPYASLEPFGANRPDLIHRIVKHNGIPYLLKAANFPHDEVVLSQEVKNYRLLKHSSWTAELGGIVERQGRKEAILVRYYSSGDLTRHFGADEKMKARWVKQLATALKELDKLGYIPQDLNVQTSYLTIRTMFVLSISKTSGELMAGHTPTISRGSFLQKVRCRNENGVMQYTALGKQFGNCMWEGFQ